MRFKKFQIDKLKEENKLLSTLFVFFLIIFLYLDKYHRLIIKILKYFCN